MEILLRAHGLDDLADTVLPIETFVRNWWKQGATLSWFTDHGAGHSDRVSRVAMQIADAPTLTPADHLSVLERYCLWAAAWLHDLGMQVVPAPLGGLSLDDFSRVRHEHPDQSANVILTQFRAIGLPDDESLVSFIAYLARSHGTKYYKESVEFLRAQTHVMGSKVRGPLLAAILLLADELDLDGRRVRPTPAEQPIIHVSQAHAAKHRRVAAANVSCGNGNCIQFEIHMNVPKAFPREQFTEIQAWIVGKLQEQVALVERDLMGGYLGRVSLSRNVRVKSQEVLTSASALDQPAMDVILADNRRGALINHDATLATILANVGKHDSMVITGRWQSSTPGGHTPVDVDGREDIRRAAEAAHAVKGGLVLASERLWASDGVASVEDVLDELLEALDAGHQRGERGVSGLADLLISETRGMPRDVLVTISSVDLLRGPAQDWIKTDFLPRIAALPNVAIILTANEGGPLSQLPDYAIVRSYGLDPQGVADYLARFTDSSNAQDEANQGLRYVQYKRLAQTHLAKFLEEA